MHLTQKEIFHKANIFNVFCAVFDQLSVPLLFRNNISKNRFLTRYSFCMYHVSCSSTYAIYDVSSLIVIFFDQECTDLILAAQKERIDYILFLYD